ncbi:PH (Pleckstrin Homology) domain-containing protein [Georgenia soli]|uniref:PH (Pleckstrin Homology) domain-containing protein n=1 Tax=Georgenia soli TaxID=638953 RepID=A0A2A9EID1_9MICO|nr:PH domain-containing protein [Georgenia soli]PFG38012.1 PH (Pleckstrin Homology) domain-containing protein [Georgenia soli]
MSSYQDLHAPFRPRSARVVTLVLGLLTVAGALVIIVSLPRMEGVVFGPADQAGTAVLALGICWFLYRQGSVAAVPSERGMVVRNIIHTRELEWAEILSVSFGDGAPWVQLDLSDGGTIAVMAIQRADGEHGRSEARRLATLVALHEERAGPPDR